jgi:hypothetical protein
MLTFHYGRIYEMTRELKHRTLPITAPESIWKSMGWRSWSDSSEVGQRDFDTGGTNGIDVYLGMAVSKGMIGAAAIGWAVEESNRRNDISRQVAAQSSEAAAIASLAAALQAGTTSSVVRDVLGRLSERTQYAVRQQLAGSGLLG